MDTIVPKILPIRKKIATLIPFKESFMYHLLGPITVPLLLNATIGFWFIFGYGMAYQSSVFDPIEERKKVETWKEAVTGLKAHARKRLFTPWVIIPSMSSGGGILTNAGIMYAIYPYLSKENTEKMLSVQIFLLFFFGAIGAINGGLRKWREAQKARIEKLHISALE